jgi:hypothetical protein
MRYLTGPLPDPPEEGWRLDPHDPTIMRYHTGEHWTDDTTSSLACLKGGEGARKPWSSYRARI